MPATHQLQQPENSLDGRRDGQCHVWSSEPLERVGSLCVYHVYQFPCWFTQSLPNDRSSVRSSCNVSLGDLGYNDSGILVSNKIRKMMILPSSATSCVQVSVLHSPSQIMSLQHRIFGLQTLFHHSALNPTVDGSFRNPANSTSWGTGSWTPIIYRVLCIQTVVVWEWDFWTINSTHPNRIPWAFPTAGSFPRWNSPWAVRQSSCPPGTRSYPKRISQARMSAEIWETPQHNNYKTEATSPSAKGSAFSTGGK